MGAVKNLHHDEISAPHFGLRRDEPSDCPECDGFGCCWNNADPTSGQWQACECGDTRGHP